MIMDTPNRKACDRCHDLKLGCRRRSKESCERCLKASQPCTSSPSLRYRKRRVWGGSESRMERRPVQIRPSPLKAIGETLLPLQQGGLLCDIMSRPQQSPITSNHLDKPQVDETTTALFSPGSSEPILPRAHEEGAYELQNNWPLSFPDFGGLQQTQFAGGVGPRYMERRSPHSVLDYDQFQVTTYPDHVEQTLLDCLSEVNLAHRAWDALRRDTTWGGTSMDCWELKMEDETGSSRPSVEGLIRLSQRFSSIINATVTADTFPSSGIDPVAALLVYSRIRDIHSIIIRLATRSLQTSKDAVLRITNRPRSYI